MGERPPLVLVPQHFGSLVFDRRSSRYMPFDREATALLRRLHAGGIDRAMAEVATPDRAAAGRFVEHFLGRGFFGLDGRLAAAVLAPPRIPADHLVGPLAVHVEVIAACNLECLHCFAGELPRPARPLALAELDRLFSDLARLGSFRLGLTGGEPLMRRDLLDVVDAATGHGLHPCLTTNGLLLDEAWARELGRRELVWLNVSLEGASPATHDPIRGDGTFAAVVAKLRLLARHARFTLAFTVMKTNLHELEACAALARDLGAHTAVFRPLYPVGVARDHLHLMPTYEEYAAAVGALAGFEPGELHGIDPFGPGLRAGAQARIFANPGCGAGNLVASVSVDGEVSGCSFLGPEHRAGSLRETGFEALWNGSRGLAALRGAGDDPACGSCDGFAGGCRVRAQVYGGSAFAADPWHDAWLAAGGLAPLGNVDVDRGEE